MTKYLISIIIPVLNEAAIIKSTLDRLQDNANLEVIVVDGGSQDNTVIIVREMGVKVITASGGRSAQMNAGAKIAQGDILLFLHGDSKLPPEFFSLTLKTLKQPKAIAGAFELAIEGEARSLRWIELLVKMRSHLFSLPYGDQGIFITKQAFAEVGGFPNLPIMEDFELIQRLKKKGNIAIAPAAVTTSGRRWQKLGVWKTTLINQLIIAGYYLGISPTKLSKFYRQQGKK
ncbi:MAG: TIGR04283 family arsenosugar biosynthesis glycosyltransferase [Pleurocapsa sp. MO_226.B13]|nr:TIGR04283 family arsenosugar biosynthesis glycosyltransferase [Pleurocapsa sp. MO_226.B13]